MKVTKKLEKKINSNVDYCIVGSGNIALRHYENIKHLDKNSKIGICKRSRLKAYNENIGNTQKDYFEIEKELKINVKDLFKINNEWYNNY